MTTSSHADLALVGAQDRLDHLNEHHGDTVTLMARHLTEHTGIRSARATGVYVTSQTGDSR